MESEKIHNVFDLTVNYGDDYAVLTNPVTGAKIVISEDTCLNGDGTAFPEYTVCFSTQHRHFSSMDKVVLYIRQILTDEILPIEFFECGRARFGGEIRKIDFDSISPKSLAQLFGYTSGYLSGLEIEVHSWSGKYDLKRTKVSEIQAVKNEFLQQQKFLGILTSLKKN